MKVELIKINYKKDGCWYDSLSFPKVANHSVSIQIDNNIVKNLNFEIDWGKKHKVTYYNEKEIRIICNELVKHRDVITKEYDELDVKLKNKEWIPLSKRKKDHNGEWVLKPVKENKTYLMKDNHSGMYKIGFSNNPKKRERTLQSEKPSINMVKVWDKNIERELHILYSEFRIRGEWFSLSKLQVKYICTHFN
jgi:hypothetical protein